MADLRLIETFIAAARHQSFTTAAKGLGISPAAVSQNIKSLEDQLQTRLFTRTTRQVRLTPEGARFLQRCAPAVEALAQATDEMRSERDAFRGRLRITSTTAFGRRFVLPEVIAFQATHPELEIELQLADQFVDLVADEFDLAIRAGTLPENEYISRLILPITPLVVASPAYLAAHGRPTRREELLQHRLIGFRSTPSQQVFPWDFAGRDSVERMEISPALILNDPEAIGLAAVAGAGIAQIGTNVCLSHVADGELEVLMPETAVRSRGIYAVYPSRRYVPTKLTAFLQHLVAAFAQRPDLVWRG
jgi:DNA-binding transcriptional LysR family regulator